MTIQTNLAGRLRNTSLPYEKGLFPFFEAVVNSIHSIEELGLKSGDGKITVKINRLSELKLNNSQEYNHKIEGFCITDNGIGFNDVNLKSFETLDTDHKSNKGCRGVGRLLWLKAFNERSQIQHPSDAGGGD